MKFRKKSWVWWLTCVAGPKTFTCIRETIYGPYNPGPRVREHERVHSVDQLGWGVFWPLWLTIYVLGFPVIWNPLRYSTEYRAYRVGSRWSHERTIRMLRSWRYGFLPYCFHKPFVFTGEKK